MKKRQCACGHFWSQHDGWGCQMHKCPCKMIDATHRYENGKSVEVTNDR